MQFALACFSSLLDNHHHSVYPDPVRSTPFLKYFLFATQFLAGAVIMLLELTGTRIISPFYGGSLQVWAGLISVTLLSLAAGYYLGGFLADKKPTLLLLMLLLALPGLFILLLPLLSPAVLMFTNALGIKLGALTSALLLFSLPLTGLGMVTPFTVKLAATSRKNLGMTTGRLYAISTLGSCSGTWLTGFLLLPNLGIRYILLLAGCVLLALALCGWLMTRKFPAAGLLCLPVTALLLLLTLYQKTPPEDPFKIIHREQSAYGSILVAEDEDLRFLMVNTSVQSFVDKQDLSPSAEYIHYLAALPFYRPGSKRALLVGLGAGSLPLLLADYGITTDVIEIDPAIVEVAGRFFGFKPTGEIFIQDGRSVINSLQKTYDFIILDAYLGGSIAYQLCSLEFFRRLKTLLPADGILAINALDFADNRQAHVTGALLRTLTEVFPGIHTYSNAEPDDMGNILFFASASPLADFVFRPEAEYPYPLTRYYLKVLPFLRQDFNSTAGVLLTDDYNPLTFLDITQTDYFRNNAVAYFGAEIFAAF